MLTLNDKTEYFKNYNLHSFFTDSIRLQFPLAFSTESEILLKPLLPDQDYQEGSTF